MDPVLWRVKCLYKDRASLQGQLAHLMNGDHIRGLAAGASCPRQLERQGALRLSHRDSEGCVPCLITPTSATYPLANPII